MKQAGWFGIGKESGRFVPEEQAFLVACKGCGIEQWNHNAQDAAEFYEMLVQWSSFIPVNVPGLAVIKEVSAKEWKGIVRHVEAEAEWYKRW